MTVEASGAPPVQARRDFETRCSACHGLDGRGGEHAPNIVTNPAVRQLTDSDLLKVVHDGIPSNGMPSFDYLSERQIKSIVSYLRFLAGPPRASVSRGNAARGQDIFFDKGKCGGCHMMHGQGGFLGAELTEYVATRTQGDASEFILEPTQFYALHQLVLNKTWVEVFTRQGERLAGVVRNEDNFSLQLLDAEGAFHLLMKSEIELLHRGVAGIAPADNSQKLSASELEDVVSYLSQYADGTRKSSSTLNLHHCISAPDGASGLLRTPKSDAAAGCQGRH